MTQRIDRGRFPRYYFPMRKPFTVGMLAETKNVWERRAPLTPKDVAWLVARRIPVEIMSSAKRAFSDTQYRRAGARVVPRFKNASLIVGVKEPPLEWILPKKIYVVFSHTTKGQVYNRPLLKEFLRKKVTLVDCEHIVDSHGERLVYFGRFAGIAGMIDSLHFMGKRLDAQGIPTIFKRVRHSLDYRSFDVAKRHLKLVGRALRKSGLPREITPFVVGITGRGNVSAGAQEVLGWFRPIEIHPRDMNRFIRHQRKRTKQIYKIVLFREEKFRAKNKKGFYFEEYLKHPNRFESNLDRYLPHLNLLINTSYWDKRFPRLVTEAMVRRLWRKRRKFRLSFIGDLACDVKGAIEITRKTTTPGNPVYTYEPKTRTIRDGPAGPGIAILAVDHLPCEFPKESSEEFSALIRDYVYQIAAHGALDVTKHAAISREIRRAVITQSGKLTPPYHRLHRFLKNT